MTDARGDTRPLPGTDRTWSIGVRPSCFRCERLAVVYDDQERPLCARHATIFMVDWEDSEEDDGS